MRERKSSSTLKIMTVDDSPVIAERLQFMLSEIDSVEFLGNALNISSALELIDQRAPNVVILDIHLKDDLLVANGVHLLIQLRRRYPEMKIIMLTNLSVPQYKSTCMAFGADYFFDKTIDFEKIPDVVRGIQLQQNVESNDEYLVENPDIKILHLEDNPGDAEIIFRYLKKNDVSCEVKVVDTAADYQNALIHYNPNIVLSDQSIPNFNSIAALEILRNSGIEIPFILVTGAVCEEFGVEAISKGADDYILKDRLYRLPIAIWGALEKYRVERERKKSEAEKEVARKKIEESEKQYVQLVHDLPAAVYTCDVNGRIMLYNKAAIELWGREPEIGEELWCGSLKLYDTEYNLIPKEESPMMMAIKKGVKIEGKEMIIERPDETRRHVMVHPTPNFNAQGEVIGAINTMIDITDCAKANLESLMLVDRLELKNKELSQFGYMLSHNLRGPIARILGLASIFDVEPNDNSFIIEKIKEATTELDDVVRDINSVVSVRNSENEKHELVSFENQFNLVKEILEREISQGNALITTDFLSAKSVRTVRNYLYSMLYNLLSNAVKFRMPEKQLHVHVQTRMEGEFVCLSVKDNGMGVDLTSNRSKIFGLYRKFHGLPGKGAGLHLVKAQAESLGGWVDVDSKVNEGAEFRIYLPAIHAEPYRYTRD
jgi:PAS domain S-box-containing protein